MMLWLRIERTTPKRGRRLLDGAGVVTGVEIDSSEKL